MVEDERDDPEDKLRKFGWSRGPHTTDPDGKVAVKLRRAPETAGEGERTIYGNDVDDAIRKEVERLVAEGTLG